MTQPALRCYSFHSVKGGVGKTTFSVLTALYHAVVRRERTLLVDMDLTGTSLADVLPLEAPSWFGLDPVEPLPLTRCPDGFLSLAETGEHLERRSGLDREQPGNGSQLAFINDFLLYAGERWDASQEAHPESFAWRYRPDPEGEEPYPTLRVSPSSALPVDLYRLLPLVYDEPYACFVEGRLEWFLHQVLRFGSYQVIVFDTPPSIPGLSRSVLSLGLRLPRLAPPSSDRTAELAPGGGTPPLLLERSIHWHPCLVTTGDLQDLRAVERWYDEASPEERAQLRIIANRLPNRDFLATQLRKLAPVSSESAELYESPMQLNAWPVPDNSSTAFKLFVDGRLPMSAATEIEEMLRWMWEHPSSRARGED